MITSFLSWDLGSQILVVLLVAALPISGWINWKNFQNKNELDRNSRSTRVDQESKFHNESDPSIWDK